MKLGFIGLGAMGRGMAGSLLAAMATHVCRFGDRPEFGSTMKMVHQLAAGCNLAVAAGVMGFGAHLGRDPVPASAAALQVFLGASAAGSGAHDDRQATRFHESLGGRPVRKGGGD